MKRYYVSVTETLNKVVSVDAESEADALKQVETAYDDSVIVLDSENFAGEVIEIEPDQQFCSDYDDSYDHID